MTFYEYWDRRFLELAKHVSTWSRDPSTKVGAVIVDSKKRVVGMGYNGFPRGVKDDEERYADRDLKLEMVVHAEANAILNAVKSVEDCIMFATFFPCPHCAALIVQSGIRQVFALENLSDTRYADRFAISRKIFGEGGVNWRIYKQESPL